VHFVEQRVHRDFANRGMTAWCQLQQNQRQAQPEAPILASLSSSTAPNADASRTYKQPMVIDSLFVVDLGRSCTLQIDSDLFGDLN